MPERTKKPAKLKAAKKPTVDTAEVEDAELVEDAPSKARVSTADSDSDDSVEGEVVDDNGEPQEPGVDELQAEEAEPDVASLAVVDIDSKVGRRDPLSAYMHEVTRHPLLTREEEVSLARKYRDSGDVQAAYKLVASNLRLVV